MFNEILKDDPGMVGQACNPSCLEGRDRRTRIKVQGHLGQKLLRTCLKSKAGTVVVYSCNPTYSEDRDQRVLF
jgi:hypothetical protein